MASMGLMSMEETSGRILEKYAEVSKHRQSHKIWKKESKVIGNWGLISVHAIASRNSSYLGFLWFFEFTREPPPHFLLQNPHATGLQKKPGWIGVGVGGASQVSPCQCVQIALSALEDVVMTDSITGIVVGSRNVIGLAAKWLKVNKLMRFTLGWG